MNLEWYDWVAMCLPVYTQRDWSYFWQLPDVRNYCATHFARVGTLARSLDVRLSMHPGQFTVLASDNPDIVDRSIEEFEYHTDVIRWMGYGRTFQDFKCNVHISGRQGPAGIKHAVNTDFLQRRETVLRSRTTKTSGASKTASSLSTPVHLYLTYTITGAAKENTYSPPTIDLNA